jgi:hypothetical protein
MKDCVFPSQAAPPPMIKKLVIKKPGQSELRVVRMNRQPDSPTRSKCGSKPGQ